MSIRSMLNTTVSIERRTTVKTGLGSQEVSWSVLHKDIPAKLDPIGGREILFMGKLTSSLTHRLYILYLSDLRGSDRVVHQGDIYDIEGIRNPSSKNIYLMIDLSRRE